MSVLASAIIAKAGPVAAKIAGRVTVEAGSKAGMALLTKAGQMVKDGQQISSLSDYARPARVEPLAIVEAGLADQEFMPDVMKTTLSIFIGYWMQAASMTGTKIGKIDPLKTLDALNPSRTNAIAAAKDAVWSKENYEDGLPSLESFQQPMEAGLVVSVENNKRPLTPREEYLREIKTEADIARAEHDARFDTQSLNRDKVKDDRARLVDNQTKRDSKSTSIDDVTKFYEIPNLAIGKMVEVELRDGEHSGKFPVLMRLLPTKVPAGVITHIFTAGNKNITLKERYHLWRAGQISFVRDLIFAVDLVDEHRKALVNDTSNVYGLITDRRRNNSMTAHNTKTPSMADASNIAIISKETAKQIGKELYGKIESVSIRQKIFNSTYLLLLVVVDEQWERVTIYHRGYDQPTEVSFRDLKTSEKNKGPDLTEIFRAFSLGASPTI